MPANWDEINRCNIWKTLGVSECDNCDTCAKCWGDASVLPEPEEEIIDLLERACDLFDKIQERKAVIRAEEIVKRASNGSISTYKEVGEWK